MMEAKVQYKKLSKEEVKEKLDELQFRVTVKDKTERPFNNLYWDNKAAGIYVDVANGEPLFSSIDKFDSGTGWPSFTRPIEDNRIRYKKDWKMIIPRTEVRSMVQDAHLGHVFKDGPTEKSNPKDTYALTGKRYCINSAALKFIPLDSLEKEGYGRFLNLFGRQVAGVKGSKSHSQEPEFKKATFAGGCFWGVEELFSRVDGVVDAVSGYMGGGTESTSYEEVSRGQSGHAEVVQITYNPNKVKFSELLSYFWRMHDPTQLNRQGPDVGTQYRSAIFYHDEEQRVIAEKSKENFDNSKVFSKQAVTQIVSAEKFHRAEDYHQDYYQNNPGKVCHPLRPE